MAAGDLTSLDNVRAYLQKSAGDTGQNAIITSMIARASLAIMRYTEREFAPTATDTARKFIYTPSDHGDLSLAPYDLRSVSGGAHYVKIDTDSATITTLTAAQYRGYPRQKPDGVYTYLRLDFPTAGDSIWAEREVEIKGDWGFSAVPADVEHWAIVQVALWLRRDVAAFESTFSLDEERLEHPQALASAVRAGLSIWRREVHI